MDKVLIYTNRWHFLDSKKLGADYCLKDLSAQRKKLEEKSNWQPMSMALKKVNGKKVLHVNITDKIRYRHFIKLFQKLNENKSKLGSDFILYEPDGIDPEDIKLLAEVSSEDITIEMR